MVGPRRAQPPTSQYSLGLWQKREALSCHGLTLMVARWRNIGFALALPVLPTCFAGKPDVQANHSRNATTKVDHKEERSCELLTDHHGSWKGSVKRGGIYVLTCDPGFAVDGKPTVNMTCNSDAEWPAKPWCEDIDDCALLLYGCGPAGLCKDLPQRAECICERGAYRDIATNGEVVCHFNKASDCGGRNCGSHGVCVHLKEYQNTFDTGNSSFRCRLSLSGSHAYLGEYTLECAEGAFVWGGTEQAMTISCPSYGRWHTVPRYQLIQLTLHPLQERRKAEEERMKVIFHVAASAVCILMAALAAGLTMGLVSLESLGFSWPVELQIIEAARLDYCANSKEKFRAPKRANDHHLLLVTLLLLNALANEALPIFLDDLLSPVFAVLLSVTFVLVCGEILPSAVFTGPWQLTFSSWFVPVVRFLLCALYCIAKPIARILDKALKKDRFERFSRPEVRAVLRLHCASQTLSEGSGFSPFRSSAQAQPLCTEEDPPEMDPPVLDDEEVDLCLAMLNLGDTLVADSPGFYTLKQCARRCILHCARISEGSWNLDVACEDITGLVKVSELLTAGVTQVGVLCRRKEVPRLEVHETVSEAVAKLGMGFGLVMRGEDFFGIFDSEEAVTAALMGEERKSSVRVAGLMVSAKSETSPSSTGSPGREPIPEAAQMMGQTLRETQMTRFRTDPPTDRFGFAVDTVPDEEHEKEEEQAEETLVLDPHPMAVDPTEKDKEVRSVEDAEEKPLEEISLGSDRASGEGTGRALLGKRDWSMCRCQDEVEEGAPRKRRKAGASSTSSTSEEEVPFEESSLLPYEPDAAVDPPEELRRKGMMEEVMWRMRWLVSRVEAMEHKEPKKKEALSLGNGWVLIQSNLVPGRRFYFNMKSGESTWERPF
eukprot:g16599.t1